MNKPVAYVIAQKNRLSVGPVFRNRDHAQLYFEHSPLTDCEIDEIAPLYFGDVTDEMVAAVAGRLMQNGWHTGGDPDEFHSDVRAALESVFEAKLS